MKRSLAARMAKGIGYVLLLLVIVTAVDVWRSQDLPTDVAALGPLTTLKGDDINLSALSERQPVLVYVWASWCGVCRIVSPMVDMVQTPVVSIALASGHDRKVNGYVQEKDYKFSVVNDADNTLSQVLGIKVTPTLMIAYKGELRYATSGITTLPGMWGRVWLAKLMG
ncbi:protein disulfide oxidoreductase [Oceanisphaera avium]|uniref:Protein disulfide oxidoreductase n=1 Tax=Oceanisphaera avium TaxID=1903694 RepID=A0A1Y0CWW1_9GAMM|nr:protein disulfide oxidoreductase [Oceanisphaera avium]ART79831.1 protein disulfide oxidoreductase [Oceanisphaera avium]